MSQLEAGNSKPPTHAAGAENDVLSLKPQPTFGENRVRVDEARGPRLLVDRHAQRIDLFAESRMRAHIVEDFADTRQEPAVIQNRLAHGDSVLTELSSVSDQPSSMGQRPHRNRPVIGRHTTEGVPSNQHGACAEVRGAQRGDNTCRSSANDEYVYHLPPSPSAAR